MILLEGFGSDQVTLRSLARPFVLGGWHVLTFDFSGHGRSPGALDFKNAQTDRLARQTLAALEAFSRLTGLPPERIYLAGHSLGARTALQSAVLSPLRLGGLILLGTQVNLSTNVQSEFFTGTSDSSLEWVTALGPQTPAAQILLVSGDWDDILTPSAANLLYRRLSAGQGGSFTREMVILSGLVHNYEPFSPRVWEAVRSWLARQTGADLPGGGGQTARVLAWLGGLAGLLLLAAGAERWTASALPAAPAPASGTEITSLPRFLRAKLLLWLAALPLAAALGGIFFFLPLARPVFNLIYVGFIGGYGLLLLILYWRGKMPGVRGGFWARESTRPRAWRLAAALAVFALALALTGAYARSGWFFVFPLNLRLVWLLIFTPFTALGFWIGLREGDLLPATGRVRAAHTLIGLLPFFLYTFLMAALGSLSGMIGGLQGLVILWLTLLVGGTIRNLGARPALAAVCMSVLLYWLLLPQGVLFR